MKAKSITIAPEAAALLRKAASFGPGLRGQRTEGTADERAQVRDRLQALGIDPPLFLEREQTWVDRKAKLFEVGDYPDKGVKVSEGTLDQLAKSFDLPVPVLIEHAKSPLQIGFLTDVQADGKELFGTLSLTKEANELIEMSGAHALSLGLSPDLCSIQEVSLVKKPRIASARVFTGEVFAEEPDWKSEYESLRGRVDIQHASSRIDGLLAEGRMIPAQVPFAQALIAQSGTVEFDGETVPIAQLVVSLLEVSPKHALFQEHAPQGSGSGLTLDPDERAFYDRYFAGLSIEDIARNRKLA